jgi:thymidylate kinase
VLEQFAKKERVVVVDGRRPVDVVQVEIRQHLDLPMLVNA